MAATHAKIVNTEDGRRILVSYDTPVAVFVPGKGLFKSERFYSRTTSRHVSQFVEKMGGAEVTPLSLADFARHVAPLAIPY